MQVTSSDEGSAPSSHSPHGSGDELELRPSASSLKDDPALTLLGHALSLAAIAPAIVALLPSVGSMPTPKARFGVVFLLVLCFVVGMLATLSALWLVTRLLREAAEREQAAPGSSHGLVVPLMFLALSLFGWLVLSSFVWTVPVFMR